MKLTFVLAGAALALSACNLAQNLGGGGGAGTTSTTSTTSSSSPASSCKDGVENGVETDVDCGGAVCPACLTGQKCLVGSDCKSGDCVANVCQAGTGVSCTDGIQDGIETDVDCGGGTCPACATGKKCLIDADCQSGDCVSSLCQAGTTISCTDGVKNGTETDVDCGGGTCSPCVTGQKCLTDSDCASNACDAVTLVCVAAQCSDHVQDGAESDVDCGGGTCSPCAIGKHCEINTDCASSDCVANVCQSGSGSTCSDGSKDGTETDVDCGGACSACVVGQKCLIDGDCVSNACDAVALVCVANQCSDHRRDGNETDVDCGGPTCAPCVTGKQCQVNADCTSNSCVSNVCH